MLLWSNFLFFCLLKWILFRLPPVLRQKPGLCPYGVLFVLVDYCTGIGTAARIQLRYASVPNLRTLFDQIPVFSRLHPTIHVIHVKRCAGVIAIRAHATKMILKSGFDLFCCLVRLGLCRILTKPSNDIINVGGYNSRICGAQNRASHA